MLTHRYVQVDERRSPRVLVRGAALLGALATAACAPGGSPTGPAGAEPSVATRADAIRNGTREPQVLPLTDGQILAIGWLARRGQPNSPFCTGTLINPTTVATAAHCVGGRGSGRLLFGVGVNPNSPVATFVVERAVSHPRLDAALLLLAEETTATVPELTPIPANRVPLSQDLIGREVEAAGYGETRDPSRFGRYFARVEFIRFDRTTLTVDGNGEQGICFGDSGGPVMTLNADGEPVVLGVESWGDASCLDRDHLVRLDAIAEWIDETVDAGAGSSDCGDVDYLGRCDGFVAEWCDSGQVRERDCGERGQRCDYVDDQIGWFCVDAGPCGEVDARGECDGEVVQRCRFGELVFEDCRRDGRVCRTDGGGAFCANPREAPEPEEDAGPAPADADVPDAGPVDAAAPPADARLTGDAATSDAEPELGGEEKKQNSGGCSNTPTEPSPGAPLAALLAAATLGLRRRERR